MTASDDDFEELRALKADMAAHHRRVIRNLVAVGVLLLALAAVAYALLDLEARPALLLVPLILGSVGAAVVARSLYSAFSDVDTRVLADEQPLGGDEREAP